MNAAAFSGHYREFMARLSHAYAAADEAAFHAILDDSLRARESAILSDVARLSESLLAALTRFRSDSRIAALAAKEIPDARLRLDHVLKMTEQAAHTTLDLIERTVPLAEATARDAQTLAESLDSSTHIDVRRFLGEVRGNAEGVRRNLTEVMLAQGFQDLSGQILQGVRRLIGEVEGVLEELAAITGVQLDKIPETPAEKLEGPVVPGVQQNAVVDQVDVDDLIAGLGI